MNIQEKLHKIKEEMRKKGSDKYLVSNIDKLLLLENEIRRNTQKCFTNDKHILHFDSGDLKIISTILKTKLNKYKEKLFYTNIDKELSNYTIITDKEFLIVMNKTIEDYKVFEKICKCYFLINTITSTVEIIELMRKQNV